MYIGGADSIELKAKSKGKYELKFNPKQKGRFKGRFVLSLTLAIFVI